MKYKFTNDRRKEIVVSDFNTLIDLVKSGQIKDNTQLFDEESDVWKKASEIMEYKKAIEIKEFNSLRNSVLSSEGPEKVAAQVIHDNNSTKKILIIISVIFIVIAVLLKITAVSYYYTDWSVSVILITLLFSVGISYVVWKLLFKEKKGMWLLAFSVIFLLISGYQFGMSIKSYHQNQKALKYFDIIYASALSDNKDTQNKIKESINKKVLDRLGPVSAIIESYVIMLQNDAKSLSAEAAELHLELLFTRQVLESPESITAGQESLKAYLDILDKHELLLKQQCEESGKKLENLKFNTHLKKDIIKGYQAGKNYTITQHSELFNLERKIINERNSLLEFMKTIQGRYIFNGEVPVFTFKADEDNYNKHLQNIKNIKDEEDSLKKEVHDKVLKDLNNID